MLKQCPIATRSTSNKGRIKTRLAIKTRYTASPRKGIIARNRRRWSHFKEGDQRRGATSYPKRDNERLR